MVLGHRAPTLGPVEQRPHETQHAGAGPVAHVHGVALADPGVSVLGAGVLVSVELDKGLQAEFHGATIVIEDRLRVERSQTVLHESLDGDHRILYRPRGHLAKVSARVLLLVLRERGPAVVHGEQELEGGNEDLLVVALRLHDEPLGRGDVPLRAVLSFTDFFSLALR